VNLLTNKGLFIYIYIYLANDIRAHYISMEAMVGGGVGLAIKRKIQYYLLLCMYTTPTKKKG
jgi:hypothetical protein